MSNYPTIDRESFQKLLASAFVVQQSQMDSQSRSALVDGLRKVAKTTGVAVGPLSDAQLPLLGLEDDDRSSGTFLSHLASMLAAHGAGAASIHTALDPALDDIAEQARLIDISFERSTPPPRDGQPGAADSMDACSAALRSRTPEVETAQFRPRDRWTPLLAIMAIALALLLGWMLGLVTVLGTAHPEGQPLRVTAEPDAARAQPEVARQADPNPSPPIGPKLMRPETPSDNSVIYQDGRPSHSFNRAQRSSATDAPYGKR
jgi:hypothetical protein